MSLLIQLPSGIVGPRRRDAERIAVGQDFLTSLGEPPQIVQVREERLMQSGSLLAAAIEFLEELLLKQAEGGNIAAIIFALKAANPAKYRDNHKVEVTGREGGPIESAVTVNQLSDAELERIIMQGVEHGELAIEGELLDAPAPALESSGGGQLRLAGPDTGTVLDPEDAE